MNTQLVGNNLSSSNQLTFTLTAAANAAALTNPYLIPGVGAAANESLPANVTFSSSAFATYADMVAYLKSVGLSIKSIRFQTDDTGNFAGSITRVVRRPNNTGNPIEILELGEFRDVALNSELADVVTISGQKLFGGGIVTIPQLSLQFSGLKANSYLKVTLEVDGWVLGQALTAL